jgi:demethylmenaquinone methyltransferase/2-methoxy-6-polyprenyl-1,4-benzoquinol methylase
MAEFSRVNRPVAEAGPYYSRLAPWYDLLAASEKKYIRTGVDLLDPKPGDKILEIGSGTGYAQVLIGRCLDGGYSIGLDLSEGMGGIARKRVNKAALIDRLGLVCSDTLPIPFPDNSFDAIFSSFTLELFDTPLIPRVLAECRRALKPGGRLVIVSLSKDQPLPLMGKLYEGMHNRFPTWADCRPIPVTHLIQAAGFRIQRSTYSSIWGIPVGTVLAI